jgi:ankyrin repeat protein
MKRQRRGAFTTQEFYDAVDAGNLTYNEIIARFGWGATFTRDHYEMTLLGAAIESGRPDFVIHLIKSGAPVNEYCVCDGDSTRPVNPLHFTIRRVRFDRSMHPVVFFLLLYGADPNLTDYSGGTAYALASGRGADHVFKHATYSLEQLRASLASAWWVTQQTPELQDIGQPLLERLWYTAGFQRIKGQID